MAAEKENIFSLSLFLCSLNAIKMASCGGQRILQFLFPVPQDSWDCRFQNLLFVWKIFNG